MSTNNSVIIKIDRVTKKQAGEITKEVISIKNKKAPGARGTILIGPTDQLNISKDKKLINIEGGNNKNGKKKK